MHRMGFTGQRLAAIFLLGLVLFNYPIIALFNKPGEIFDIPLLYFYIFCAWAFMIGLMAWVVERRKE